MTNLARKLLVRLIIWDAIQLVVGDSCLLAIAGIVPVLQRVMRTAGPAKEFAFSILTDLAQAGRRSREILWQHDGLDMYIGLLAVSGHEVNAMEGMVAL